jgi:hypothetical protein
MTRSIPHPLHAAVEVAGGAALIAAPFLLGLGQGAAIVSVVLGALAIGFAFELAGPARTIPLSTHAAFDYVLAFIAAVAGVAIGIATGEWRATVFLVGVGVVQTALTASTRWSTPVGA